MPGLTRPAPGGVTPGSESERAGVVQAAAQKWGIPSWVLWGVYGTETRFGSDVKTSSTGAVGSFQFEPSTAAAYGYPVTNATDLKTFAAQANGAAHYLSDLFHQTNSWDTAISHYNSGPAGAYQPSYVASVHSLGPNISTVKLSNSTWVAIAAALGVALPLGAAAAGPEAIIGALGGGGAAGDTAAGGGAGGAAGTAAKIAGTVAGAATTATLISLLTDVNFWIRIGEGLLGAALLLLGLRALTGGDGNPVTVASGLAKKTATAAMV